jgi:predicted FMN-binding regulatory protein PaiB
MSQNRPAQDVSGVLEGLARDNGESHEAVRDIVAARQERT